MVGVKLTMSDQAVQQSLYVGSEDAVGVLVLAGIDKGLQMFWDIY